MRSDAEADSDRPIDVEIDSAAPSYTAVWHGKPLGRVQLQVPGLHTVSNSLAAVAVGLTLGVPFDKIAAGLAELHRHRAAL